MPAVSIKVKLTGLKKFQSALQSDLRLKSNGPIRSALQDWVVIWGRFLTERYQRFSQGGGNWPALKPATLVAKERKGLLPWILRATDLMFQAFAPELVAKPGYLSEEIPFGVRLKFGGGMHQLYPGTTKTVAEVAMYHQQGGGNLPQRKIIVPPDVETRKKMRDRMDQGVNELLKDTCTKVGA
jgi:hypothetical protein